MVFIVDVIRGVTGRLLCVPHAARPPLRTSIISTTRLASTALSLLPFTWWWVQCRSARCVSTNGRSTWWHKEMQPRPDLWPPIPRDQTSAARSSPLKWIVWGSVVGWAVRLNPSYLFSTLVCLLFEMLRHSVNTPWKWPKVNLQDGKLLN